MIPDRREDKILYGRIITSVVLYALFIIFSTSAVLTRDLQDQAILLGGLLIGATLILPRAPRRPKKDDEEVSEERAQRQANIQRWLTFVRLAYLLVAVFLWVGLPTLL